MLAFRSALVLLLLAAAPRWRSRSTATSTRTARSSSRISRRRPEPSRRRHRGARRTSPAAHAGLPYELRQVVQRYPVTLYTSDECGPCGAGRSLLVTRGVPFEERTVKTNEDVDALQRLSGQDVPAAAVDRRAAAQGLLRRRMVAVPRCGRLSEEHPAAGGYRSPPAQPLVALQPARVGRGDRPRADRVGQTRRRPPAAAARPDAEQPGRHQVLESGPASAQSKRSVSTPAGVPSRHTWARWWANTPTVTTPGHWFTSVSKPSGSVILQAGHVDDVLAVVGDQRPRRPSRAPAPRRPGARTAA